MFGGKLTGLDGAVCLQKSSLLWNMFGISLESWNHHGRGTVAYPLGRTVFIYKPVAFPW